VNVVSVAKLFAGYGPYQALMDLSFSIEEGESVAIVGSNGAGKSTVARVLSGLVPISSGMATVLGCDVRVTPTHELVRKGLIHLPEGVGLFTNLSISENIELRCRNLPRIERRQRVEEAMEIIGSLSHRRTTLARDLSGGQQRLVAISSAIVARPAVLLCDEPVIGLSPVAIEGVYEVLRQAQSHGVTLLLVESRADRVQGLCSRTIVLERGRLAFDGPSNSAQGFVANRCLKDPPRSN